MPVLPSRGLPPPGRPRPATHPVVAGPPTELNRPLRSPDVAPRCPRSRGLCAAHEEEHTTSRRQHHPADDAFAFDADPSNRPPPRAGRGLVRYALVDPARRHPQRSNGADLPPLRYSRHRSLVQRLGRAAGEPPTFDTGSCVPVPARRPGAQGRLESSYRLMTADTPPVPARRNLLEPALSPAGRPCPTSV